MPAILYSDNQHNVDALARRIVALTSFTSEQARLVAHALLCRKSLKIKSSALAQLFRSVDKDLDTKAMRAEFLNAGLLVKLESTGLDGKPAIYSILAEVEEPVAAALAEGEDACADVESEAEAAAEEERAVEGEPVAREEPATGDADVVDDADAAGDADAPADEPAPAFVSMVGRGSRARQAARAYEPKHAAKPAPAAVDEKVSEKPGKSAEKAAPAPEKKPEPASEASAAEARPSAETPAPEAQVQPQKQDDPEPKRKKKRRHRRKPKQTEASASQGAEAERDQRERDVKPKAPEAKRGGERNEAPAREQRRPRPRPEQREQRSERPAAAADERTAKATPLAIARVLGGRIMRVLPHKAPVQESAETRIVKAEHTPSRDSAVHREARGISPKQQLNSDFAAIVAWIEQARGTDVAYASRRQRAFEIFNDEKAFDGKRGERLFKRLNERGVNVAALKITPLRSYHFQSFFGIGADKPFIMVENIDVYEEIARLLHGKTSVKLFGVRVGGVIFGGGCKAAVSHALDDYLGEIGYPYDYVYYAGDIDREGARIVEQARAANNTRVRLHAGMYRAMLAKHRDRLKAGRTMESAAQNQGVPQNLAQVVKDLPMITRVQFCNVLREGGRIPQEILSSADYRDSSSNRFDRMLNK